MIYSSSWQLLQYQDAYSTFVAAVAGDVQLLAKIEQRLNRLRISGNQSQPPVSKLIEDGVFECKADSAQHWARLFFCFLPERKIVILLGVLKDQKKLRRVDIDEAKRRMTIVQTHRELARGID